MWFVTEIKRILRPGGIYIFIEHVAAEGTTSDSKKSSAERVEN